MNDWEKLEKGENNKPPKKPKPEIPQNNKKTGDKK